MQTYLDDQPLSIADGTLATAIDAAAHAAGQRLIVLATADGAPVPDEHLTQPPANDPYCSELHFTTADPASLVRVTLHEAADSLDTLADAHQQAAKLFQTGDNDNALNKLRELLDVWQTTEQTITTCRAVTGVSIDHPDTNQQLQHASKQLSAALNDIKSAIANRDLTTVADITAYDLAEQSDTWASLLRSLADNTTSTT